MSFPEPCYWLLEAYASAIAKMQSEIQSLPACLHGPHEQIGRSCLEKERCSVPKYDIMCAERTHDLASEDLALHPEFITY